MRSLERRTRRLEEVAGGRGQAAFLIVHDGSIEQAQRKYMEEHPEKPAAPPGFPACRGGARRSHP